MVSERARRTSSFIAMDVLERASECEDVVHLEVGEPDLEPPAAVVEALVDAVRGGATDYTAARGVPELRRAIAARYGRVYGVDVDPGRVVVTPGSSPALLLAVAALVDPGDDVVLTDPHYACYPNFVRAVGGRVETVPLRPESGFQPDVADYEAAVEGGAAGGSGRSDTAAILLNSPANPTGTVLPGETIEGICEVAADAGATVVSDEIYHGLAYDAAEHSVLEYTDDAVVLDGVSKRYGMTGWRLGWAVLPPELVEPVNRLAQNVLICAPSFVQHAGVAALESSADHLEDLRATYRERRDLLLDAVADWGLDVGYEPAGAYYLLVDVSDLPGDAVDVADLLLEDAGVAVTPGVDFGERASDYLRLSFATSTERIREGIERIDGVLADLQRA